MKVAQQMVADLFSDNHGRSLATEQILSRVGLGNLEAASAIVDDAKQIDSPTAKAIVAAAEKAHAADLTKGRSYQAASEAETVGFVALTQGNLPEAKTAFDRATQLAPDYHNVSEISGVLKAAGDTPDAAKKQAVAKEIVTKYSWKMPDAVKDQLRQQAAAPRVDRQP